MLDIAQELKDLYKQDSIPKKLTLYFPGIDLTIENDKIVNGSFSLEESLCSDTDLTLGSCEASQFKIVVADIIQDLNGLEFTVTQTVNGTHTMPLGTYIVYSCERQSDRRFKEILAYDSMKNTDVDVSSWYNALTFPITVKSIRESLLNYLGISYEGQTLTNDSVTLEKTISPSLLIGRDILKRICEINAGFGHITRENEFKIIQLAGLGLYPSETLYPSEDLFPSESGETITSGYISIDYKEYVVEQITSLKIRQDDDDSGTTSGNGDNTYIITGNYLLYGKSSAEMQIIADNILLQLKNKYYRPHSTVMIGLPYVEVGDSVLIVTSNDVIESFIFKRTLTGINALQDQISATGNQKRSESTNLSTEIQQLKGKTLRIQKNIDELRIDMDDADEQLSSQISLTAGQLQTQITDNKNDANSQISQLADNISLKVSKGDVSSQLSVESGQVYIGSNRLVIDSTNLKLDANGNAIFSGYVEGAVIISESGSDRTVISDGWIESTRIVLENSNRLTYINPGTIQLSASGYGETVILGGEITCNTMNGGTPITTANRNNYIYPPSSHNHSSLYNGSYSVFVGTGGGFASTNGGDLGSSTYRWGTVYAQSGTINTSDRTLKNSIEDLPEVYKQLILKCRSVRFKYNDGTSDRYHTGFVSQDVEQVLTDIGIDSQDFAGFVKAPIYAISDEEGTPDNTSEITGYVYMLRYEEFISPMVALLQSQEKRIARLENRAEA